MLFFLSASTAFVLSIAAKLLADTYLNERISLWGDFLGLQFSLNPGIAFGLRLPPVWQEVFIIVALTFVCWLGIKSATTTTTRIGYGLIAGGGAANVADRLLDGYVTDFFQVGTFPIFNVADSCITIGVAFLLADIVISGRNTSR